ncbi:ExeA family protein [Massilia sp. TS11]|uniref:ExeA family protein n=1 Tax=Massilia sp. TS11 TaxID=2908003 RepID=UPI001EDBD173|nr:ExeA family protein [Massilia sp. TS11]MCG2585653.1 AAA family ATPase [Massilia sp. TS11]
MYQAYFHLRQLPFSIAPDPHYLYMSERHREALAHLLYGVGSGGGFVLLTGEIGAGKTTVCRCFIEQVPDNCKLAYIFNPRLSVPELLQSVCEEYGIAQPPEGAGVKAYVDAINAFLLDCHARGLNNVLIIDEAQNLAPEVLEQLRLLTNLETSERKLLQIILIGQPELRGMLARPELEQLAQRVIARYHLGPLSAAETAAYVQHRLAVAGISGATPLPPALMPLVHRLSGGVPRRINLLCDRALLGTYAENRAAATRAIVRKAAAEVFGNEGRPSRRAWWLAPALLGLAALAAAIVWQPPAPAPRAPAAPLHKPAPAPLPLFDSAEAAQRELARLWGTDAGQPCTDQAVLHCMQARLSLFEIRALDRPVLLGIREGEILRYAVLTGLDGERAWLQKDGQRVLVPLARFAARLDGEVLSLWRSAPAFRDALRAGDSGADVDWVAAVLAKAEGRAAPAPGLKYDAAMQAAVRQLQQDAGLKADGRVGPRTWIRLNQLAGIDEPRLQALPRP